MPEDTTGRTYTARLRDLSGASWKQRLNVQAPYRWNLRRFLDERRTLDVGCGIGRNLVALGADSVGVDHNPYSVTECRAAGLSAYTLDEFAAADLGRFDALLVAHVLEHLEPDEVEPLLASYLPHLNPGAVVMLLCPQARGYASDPTHVTYYNAPMLEALCREVGLKVERSASFPLPRVFGGAFTYNEFVVVARVRVPRV